MVDGNSQRITTIKKTYYPQTELAILREIRENEVLLCKLQGLFNEQAQEKEPSLAEVLSEMVQKEEARKQSQGHN